MIRISILICAFIITNIMFVSNVSADDFGPRFANGDYSAFSDPASDRTRDAIDPFSPAALQAIAPAAGDEEPDNALDDDHSDDNQDADSEEDFEEDSEAE